MIEIRAAESRGRTRLGWLDSHHAFSFGQYRDPSRMGFRALRVVNDDWIAPASGFGMHPHRDMEILSFVSRGALEHRDSMGHGAVIGAAEVQRMTAGTGVLHSEFNPSEEEPTRILQVWIEPEVPGLEPSWEQRAFGDGWQLVASGDAREGSLRIHQDASVYRGRLAADQVIRHELAPGRHAWLQVARGEVAVGESRLRSGDAAAVRDESAVIVRPVTASEVLLFDLA
jgi:redox-sensitive bicupin YhaK (pirin superfamily)